MTQGKFCSALIAARRDSETVAQKLGLTTQQVLNLARLADYLRGLPEDYEDFGMTQFMADRHGREVDVGVIQNSCGTVACAVGHGPAAGIQPLPGERQWWDYSYRAFVNGDHPLWEYLFSSGWDRIDDTHHGAAARIAYALAEPEEALVEASELLDVLDYDEDLTFDPVYPEYKD